MSYFSDFSFDNNTRITEDQCYLDQRSIQNTAQCNYMTQNFFSADSTMAKPISLATSQPGVFFNGGHSVGAGGYNIDESTMLQRSVVPDEPISRLDLFSRPFVTVPFLGRGAVNPDLEHKLIHGTITSSRKTQVNSGEVNHLEYTQMPLLPDAQKHVDSLSVVLESGDQDWQRGGIHTREMNRDMK